MTPGDPAGGPLRAPAKPWTASVSAAFAVGLLNTVLTVSLVIAWVAVAPPPG